MMTDHVPMSPLHAGSSELDKDVLDALDEMLAFTPDSNFVSQPPLDPAFQLADTFAIPEVPNPYDQHLPPVEQPKPAATPSPSDKQSGKDVRTAPYAPAKPQRRRKRPKDELDYLRVKVSELQEELTKLTESAGRLSPSSDEDDELFSRWKQVAERQKEEANRTVVENLKLRAMLEGQIQIAKRLEAAIADHQQEAEHFTPWIFVAPPDANVECNGTQSGASDEEIFAELNGCLEEQYARTDAVLAESGIGNISQDTPGGIQLVQDANGISFGHKEVRLLPFDKFAVNRVMWSVLLYDDINPQMGRIQTRILNNDHLNATIVDTLQLPKSSDTKINMRMAIRRYFETDRVVVVWSANIEIAGSVFVRLREKGLAVVSSFDFLQGNRSASMVSPTGSVLRSVVDVKPQTVEFQSDAESGARIGEMTDLVIGTYHRNFGLLFQIMENLLLSDVMEPKT